MTDFEHYVTETIDHYRDRVIWFQALNEPVYTDYSLPRKSGYDGATYARLTQAFAQAARKTNPQCKILAGIGALSQGRIMEDFRTFFAAGGLECIDAVDIHLYPRIRPPEFAEPLMEELNGLMDKHGGRKPIWLTEIGYYADDEPSSIPMSHKDFNQPLPNEQVQAAYAVRLAAIMFANGVEKIFYHAGTCAGVNSDNLQGVFFEYAGEPHKIYAAQAVMASIFTPDCRFVKRLSLGDALKGYLFHEGKRLFAVVWSMRDTNSTSIELSNSKLKVWDIMGREVKGNKLPVTGTPLYLIGNDVNASTVEKEVKIISSPHHEEPCFKGP